MKIRAIVLATALVAAACTAVHYESPRLRDQVPDEQTLAVLPFEMTLVGNPPKDLTPAEIESIEEIESLVFQHSLYNQLLDRSSVNRKRPILVRLQPIETTNRILDDKGIDLRATWTMPAEELGEVLGVDAVVRTQVEKARYISDIASYGTEVGLTILHEATEGRSDWLVPPGLTRTHDIHAEGRVVSATDGDLLWKVAVHRATDWRRPANDVVAGITRKLAKKFPYRG